PKQNIHIAKLKSSATTQPKSKNIQTFKTASKTKILTTSVASAKGKISNKKPAPKIAVKKNTYLKKVKNIKSKPNKKVTII
ncbi:MAG: hypothetical protein K9G11_01965, partial [Rickettsiaceae bacterium]|nr:hypothetical protein [Rickettsiaceae bacterium]